MSVVIAKPSVAYERAFIALVADFESCDLENASFYAAAKRGFEKYVQSLLDEELGLNLSDGRVPSLIVVATRRGGCGRHEAQTQDRHAVPRKKNGAHWV